MKVIKQRFVVMIRVVRINHVGLPRSGKTSFRRRMTGEIENIEAAYRRGEMVQPSTGVAENCGQVIVRSATASFGIISSKTWSAVKDLGEEAKMLNQFFFQMANPNPSPIEIQKEVPSVPKKPIAAVPKVSHVSTSLPQPFTNKGIKTNQYHIAPTLLEKVFGFFGVTPGGKNISEMFSVIEDSMKIEDWEKVKYLLEDTILLINTDTGGQGEFLDLQASLVQGPSLNLLFSRLVDHLDSLFKIYYTNEEGLSTDEEDSTMTVEEVLFQALSSIACFGSSFCEADSIPPAQGDTTTTTTRDHLLKHSKSKVMFVGTHRDKVSAKELKRKDELLQQKLKDTEFYDKDIIEFASPDQLMVAVDNMNGNLNEVEEIRTILERVIEKNFEKIAIPAAWLMLSLHIRSKKCRTMSLADCEKLALKLRIKSDELQDALWFLHHHVGVLLYYPEVESLRGTVICEMQVVFDSATNLIKNTFTFDSVGQRASEKFREKAQFSLDDVKTAMLSHTDALIPLEKLVKLLQHLGILTTVPNSSSSQEPTYFMPCVLKSARASLLSVERSRTDPAPLMLRYECGYVPVGVFPAMITNLVSQQMKGWKMIEEGIYKNRVQFFVGEDYDKVTLISRPRYFEIVITRSDELFLTPAHSVCADIRSVIQSTLATVTSRMNYRFTMKYKFGFECPTHPGKEHLCVLVSETARRMECLENFKKPQPVLLEPHHKVWFTNCEIAVPKSSALSTDNEAASGGHEEGNLCVV